MAVKVADEAGTPYYYSTKGALQQIICRNGTHITGGLDSETMVVFCRSHDIRLLIDAAHPFAVGLHDTVANTSKTLKLPVIRVERRYPERSSDVIWCDNYDDAVRRLNSDGIDKLLALTGVQTIGKLRSYWQTHTCWFRILAREESITIAQNEGFDKHNLIYYEENNECALIEQLSPQAILTKESGETGGFLQKVKAAQQYGIDERDILMKLGEMRAVGGQEDLIYEVAQTLAR